MIAFTKTSLLWIALALVAASRISAAPSTAPAKPATQPNATLAIDVVTEDGQKLIRAKLSAGGKPVEDATISFGVKRRFGTLSLGEDRTLDDGSAAVKFPSDLPGGATGTLHVIAHVTTPPQFASVQAQRNFTGAKMVAARAGPLPRALWAPRAPFPLLIPIVALVVGVWLAYLFVFIQVLAIRKGARK